MTLQDRIQAMFQKTIDEEKAFLDENSRKQGVATLPSGLQYQVLTNGGGTKPEAASVVTVHYEGSLLSGKVFDSSCKRGAPATFGVQQVIAGWTEALQLMPSGSTWRLFIPASLGYGARGAGGSVPPYSTLVFDVELLGVK